MTGPGQNGCANMERTNMDEKRRQNLSGELKYLIDRCSLTDVLDLLAGICAENADHLRANWPDDLPPPEQNERAAKIWEHAAQKVARLVPEVRSTFECTPSRST